ncbi:hypothetical protein HNY73_011013 [Argiope bruennichi]|uniref:Uncharacterized protein n=1 Tax=Argiope bruennichi TaxID=94029 RepID=A0A8T0F7S2_ARGBR|nr:hypothetical protein HNY73_011013 [Argiope bruennichi]
MYDTTVNNLKDDALDAVVVHFHDLGALKMAFDENYLNPTSSQTREAHISQSLSPPYWLMEWPVDKQFEKIRIDRWDQTIALKSAGLLKSKFVLKSSCLSPVVKDEIVKTLLFGEITSFEATFVQILHLTKEI